MEFHCACNLKKTLKMVLVNAQYIHTPVRVSDSLCMQQYLQYQYHYYSLEINFEGDHSKNSYVCFEVETIGESLAVFCRFCTFV